MWQPWVGHYFPSFSPTFDSMIELRWSTYLAMHDAVKAH